MNNYETYTYKMRWPWRVRFFLWKQRVRRRFMRRDVREALERIEKDIERQVLFGPDA